MIQSLHMFCFAVYSPPTGAFAASSSHRRGALVLPGLLCLLLSIAAQADSFRCGKRLVRSGDSPEQLLLRCGEPQSRDSVRQEYWVNGSLQKVRLERWHYRLGGGKLSREVLIYRDEIVGITLGDR